MKVLVCGMNQGKAIDIEVPGKRTVRIMHDGAEHFELKVGDGLFVTGPCEIRNDSLKGKLVVVQLKPTPPAKDPKEVILSPGESHYAYRHGKRGNPRTSVKVG